MTSTLGDTRHDPAPAASRSKALQARRRGTTGKSHAPPDLTTPHAWIGVVSRAHVLRGVAGGFAQLNHGRAAPLQRMAIGDWLVYYSPREAYPDGAPLKAFTAIGRVAGEAAYRFDMGGGFVPHRRDMAYTPARETPVAELAPRLRFIREHPNWGMLARRGHFEIGLDDLGVIAEAMGVREEMDRSVRR